jgi:hypothetical protein
MKAILVVVLTLGTIPFYSNAQSRSSIGLSSAYLYSYRSLASSGNNGDLVKESRDKNESGASGLGFSVDFIFSLSEKFYLRSALAFNSFGYVTQMSSLKFGSIIDSTGSSGPSAPISIGKLNHRFTSLSIPFLIGFKMSISTKNDEFLYVQTGLNNHFILSSKTNGTYGYIDGTSKSISTDNKSSYRDYYISSYTGIGYLYQPNQHGVAVTIYFDYGLSPINKTTTYITQRSYFGGVNLSYNYRFNAN